MTLDAEALLSAARRPMCLGIGGGGDVVGALATAEACRLYAGADPVIGGVTWERRVIDPDPGPRSEAEIEGARSLAPAVMAASAGTRVRASGVRFAEARMAELLGQETVLVDVTRGPAAIADGIAAAARALECDLVVFVDVGGDALAHGDEPGLASPLCDAVMMAAAARLADGASPAAPSGAPPTLGANPAAGANPASGGAGASGGEPQVLGAVFGIGCDGELTPAEVLARISEVAAVGGLAGARGLTAAVVERLDEAVAAVPTEASAQALRCFRGERGGATIRGGRRNVDLSPLGASTIYFDVRAAVRSAARLARALESAAGLEEANEALHALGVRTELDLERAT
jgi:hypothetical protein